MLYQRQRIGGDYKSATNVTRQSVVYPAAAALCLRHTKTTQYYLLGDVHGL